MLQINQIKIPVEKTFDKNKERESLLFAVANKLNIPKDAILQMEIQKKSMDARKKPQLYYVYCVYCNVKNEDKILRK